jgi:signal transduction histidine kinase
MGLLSYLRGIQEITGAVESKLLDQEGRALAHSNVLEKGRIYPEGFIAEALRSEAVTFRERIIAGESVLELAQPLWREKGASSQKDFILDAGRSDERVRAGTLVYGVPLREVRSTEGRILKGVCGIFLAALLAMIAAFSVFFRSVLRPVRRLDEAVRRLGAGESDVRIPVVSKDELGELSACFNSMSGSLAEARVFLEGILENMAEALLVTDEAGIIVRINPAAARLLGYAPEHLKGQPIDRVLPRLDKGEAGLRSAAGETIPVLLSHAPLTTRGGASLGKVYIAADLREHERIEKIARNSEKLSSIGRLAAGVAHEINNPLGVILGFAQSLRKRAAADSVERSALSSIEREAERCRDLVRDLLLFSRQSQGDVRRETGINDLVRQAMNLISGYSKHKDVEVKLDLAQDLPKLKLNGDQMVQVIVNLASNAFDAMPEGGTLTVSTGLRSSPSSCVVLRVRDTGKGIPPEVRGRIFEPFFTTKDVGRGTGLGLSLVHEIVQKHEGIIELESAADQGTTFTLSFPV